MSRVLEHVFFAVFVLCFARLLLFYSASSSRTVPLSVTGEHESDPDPSRVLVTVISIVSCGSEVDFRPRKRVLDGAPSRY